MTKIRREAAGSCSFPTVQKSCRELLQGGNRKRRPKILFFFADYQNFRTVTLIALAQAGIDARTPFLSRRIRWTPPSFPWHNRVSAWLSLRVRASDYGWCPNIHRFLYLHARGTTLVLTRNRARVDHVRTCTAGTIDNRATNSFSALLSMLARSIPVVVGKAY